MGAAICERFLGSVRGECLDQVLVLSERHLLTLLVEYCRYFNEARPHPKGSVNAFPSLRAPGAAVETLLRGGTPARSGPEWSTMRRTSLVHAKAHLSELVDEAEHKKRAVIILRHGKPAAAIVPVEAVPGLKRAKPRPMNAEESRALLDELAASAPDTSMNIEEALGRNRLDRS